jgi:hypothetical protein
MSEIGRCAHHVALSCLFVSSREGAEHESIPSQISIMDSEFYLESLGQFSQTFGALQFLSESGFGAFSSTLIMLAPLSRKVAEMFPQG